MLYTHNTARMVEESLKPTQMRDWLLLALCGTLSTAAFFSTGRIPGVGDQVEIAFTVIPKDQQALGCASEESIAGVRCAYKRPERDASAVNVKEDERLAPYVTTDKNLVLLAGVFAHAEVRAEAKKRRKNPRSDRRFVLSCEVELLHRVASVPIRFSKGADFQNSEEAWVAKTLSCRVE